MDFLVQSVFFNIVKTIVLCIWFDVQVEKDRQKQQMVNHYMETRGREHLRILARHKIIEDRKEYLERMNSVRVSNKLIHL